MNIEEIGAMIYLCEGTKEGVSTTGGPVRRVEVCNSNPIIIKFFLEYLRRFDVNERNLRARLFLHLGDNEIKIKKYWSKITNIPESQFLKTSWKKSSNWAKHRLFYGTLAVRYGNVKIFKKIMNDIDFYFQI